MGPRLETWDAEIMHSKSNIPLNSWITLNFEAKHGSSKSSLLELTRNALANCCNDVSNVINLNNNSIVIQDFGSGINPLFLLANDGLVYNKKPW